MIPDTYMDKLERELRNTQECLRAFVIAECDYMRRNNLGDPEQQHNVRWARWLGITAGLLADAKGE